MVRVSSVCQHCCPLCLMITHLQLPPTSCFISFKPAAPTENIRVTVAISPEVHGGGEIRRQSPSFIAHLQSSLEEDEDMKTWMRAILWRPCHDWHHRRSTSSNVKVLSYICPRWELIEQTK